MKQPLLLDLNGCYLLDFKRYHFLNCNLVMAVLKTDCQAGFGHLPSLVSEHLILFAVCARRPRALCPAPPEVECRGAMGLLHELNDTFPSN